MIERDKALDLLDEIRGQFPMELSEAKKLLASRNEYLASAKREGELIRKQAEEQARQMVAEDELLAQAKQAAAGDGSMNRRVWHHVTVFEEVGHGASASVPAGVTEALSVDMGCVGAGLGCDEFKVSICTKDSHGPYHYDVVSGLIDAARRAGADFAVDVYPQYGSDVEASLRAGHDIRHGLIGPGVYASHGYERSHRRGVENTLKLLDAYLA